MKWLEGWFGTASGVMGALIIAIISIIVPVNGESSGSQMCSSIDGGPTTCSPMQTSTSGPQSALLISLIIVFLLFILVVTGTWLDLRGRRTAGRVILLISATLLISALIFMVASGPDAPLAFIYPFALLAFVAGILACVRRAEPRSVALSAPQPSVSVRE